MNRSSKWSKWFRSNMGNMVLGIESNMLRKLKRRYDITRLLCIGCKEQAGLMRTLQAKENILVTEAIPEVVMGDTVCASAAALPLPPNSVDFVLLPHSLDMTKQANLILREVNICLQAEGYLVILGFNPWSLWGLRRLFSLRKQAPWGGHFHSSWQVKDWLGLLNYEITFNKKYIYRPFSKSTHLFKKLAFLEPMISLLLPFAGSAYIIVAKKKVFGVTPLRPQWQKVRKVSAVPAGNCFLDKNALPEASSGLHSRGGQFPAGIAGKVFESGVINPTARNRCENKNSTDL